MKTSQKTRVLSLVLALVLSFSLCPAALADLDPSDYSDLSEDHWAYDSMMYCSEWNIVKGYDDGTFRPDDKVTDAQWVAMVTRTFYADEVAAAQSEKPVDAPWYWANTKVAADQYLTDGMTINDKSMNRYDMANVAKNVIRVINSGRSFPTLNLQDAVPSQVKDWSSVPNNRTMAIKVCYATGIIAGMSDGKFHGEQSMTRAQACVLITRMLNVINGETPGVPSAPQQPETLQQTTTGTLANGQPATVENVWAILEEIKAEYPTGTSWGYHDTPGTNYYKDGDQLSDARSLIGTWADTTYACGGWATMVSNRIFGMTGAPTREVKSLDEARPGDIVLLFDGEGNIGHVAIFLKKANSAPYVANGMTLYRYTVTDKNGVEHHDCFYHTCDGNVGHPFYPNDRVVDWSEKENDGVRSALEIGRGTGTRIFTRYPD